MNEIDSLVKKACGMMLDYSAPGLKRRIKNMIKRMLGRKVAERNFISWPCGLCALGLVEYLKAYPQGKHAKTVAVSIESFFDRWIENGSRIARVEDVLAGYVLLEYINVMSPEKEEYLHAADLFSDYLNDARKDAQGTYVYNPLQKENIVLADMLGMVCPFLAKKHNGISDSENAILQIRNFVENSYDPGTGLLYHGYEYIDGKAEKTGIVGWGRTMGWSLMGICLALDEMTPGTEGYELLRDYLMRLTFALRRYLRPDGLFSWQLTQKGPEDTSGSAMIAYSLQKAINSRVFTPDDRDIYESACNIVSRVHDSLKGYITEEGNVEGTLSECLGPGIHPQKYGSYPWSVGPTLALLSIYDDTSPKEANI